MDLPSSLLLVKRLSYTHSLGLLPHPCLLLHRGKPGHLEPLIGRCSSLNTGHSVSFLPSLPSTLTGLSENTDCDIRVSDHSQHS